MVLHLYLGILVRHRGSDKGRKNRLKYRLCNISAIVAWNWHNYIIYYEGIMLEKNEREDNKGLQYGTVQYNTDSANLARIPVFLETIIMETIKRSLPPNGTVSTCLGTM